LIKNNFVKNRHGQLLQNLILHNSSIFNFKNSCKPSPMMTNRQDRTTTTKKQKTVNQPHFHPKNNQIPKLISKIDFKTKSSKCLKNEKYSLKPGRLHLQYDLPRS